MLCEQQEATIAAAPLPDTPRGPEVPSRCPAAVRSLYLLDRRCSPLFTHLTKQQVRKAMDMSMMMAQLMTEEITATLKPKVS